MASTLTLPADVISGLPVAKGTCHKLGKVPLILFKSADGTLLVAPNTCVHMSQQLAPDVEDTGLMKCSMHNAKLCV